MNKLVQQEYHDLTGRNYNFYTEKCMETAALQTLNEGGSLGNNKEYFKTIYINGDMILAQIK